MYLEDLPDTLFVSVTSYLDEEEVKKLKITCKRMEMRITNNIVINNRLLTYELKIAKCIIREVKKDPFFSSNSLLATKQIKNGELLDKALDPLSQVQKLYISSKYRFSQELFLEKQFKIFDHQKRRLEKRRELIKKEDELYKHKPEPLYIPEYKSFISMDDIKNNINNISSSEGYLEALARIDNYIQTSLVTGVRMPIEKMRKVGKHFCPHYWLKSRKKE